MISTMSDSEPQMPALLRSMAASRASFGSRLSALG